MRVRRAEPKQIELPDGFFASEAAKSVGQWADSAPKRKYRGTSKKTIQRYADESAKMRESGEWGDAMPHHLVALYLFCHRSTYGVIAQELFDGKIFDRAVGKATLLVKRYCEGDIVVAVEFIRWVWGRERARERWRRENHKSGGRIGWWSQFDGGNLWTDWRIDLQRVREEST